MEEVINGVFIKRLFLDEHEGTGAFLFETKGELVSAYGPYCFSVRYVPLDLRGEWTVTDRGRQFRFTEAGFAFETQDIKYRALFYKELNKKLSDRKAAKLARIDPEKLGKKRNADAKKCAVAIERAKYFTELLNFLYAKGGDLGQARRVFNRYGGDSLEALKKRPFEVFDTSKITFKVADTLSKEAGIDPLAEDRVKAVLTCCMRSRKGSGDVYMKLDDLYEAAQKYGQIPKTLVLDCLQEHPDAARDPDHEETWYLSTLLSDERQAAKEFARLMYSRRKIPMHPELISRIEEEIGHPFGKQQKEAFQLMNSTGVKLLTGDPGTGKTTTLNGLLRYLELVYEKEFGQEAKIALCAPSGRAAQRMSESTGREALTVHKLLNYQPFEEEVRCKDASDPIDADIVVVDETSMLGLSIFEKLEAAIKSGSMLLLIGDTNQLQSVDPGCVLHDIIQCGYVDSCHLTEVFRQAKESCININAKKVMRGDKCLVQGDDFRIVHTRPEDTPSVLEQEVKALIQEAGDRDKVQVLSPVKKGSCGVRRGNTILQKIFNPGKGGMWYGAANYRKGDRVIMLSNNYELGYYNGSVGYIEEVSDSSVSIRIGGSLIEIGPDHYEDMNLAYECTIHKSQGSEYDYLIIVMQNEAAGMMTQNLLYTGITRGKKKVVLIYEGNTVQRAIQSKNKNFRRSHLSERICSCEDELKK